MKVVMNAASFALIVVASATMAIAQPPRGGPGGEGGPGGNDPGRAVLMALDTDGNHEISAAEIQYAATALLKLDTNGDGKLSDEDRSGGQANKRSQRVERGGNRPQGPPPSQGGAGSESGHGPPTPDQLVEHAMEFDTDKDGKLDKAELLKFAEQLGPPQGGPDGQEGNQGGGDRPQRPNR